MDSMINLGLYIVTLILPDFVKMVSTLLPQVQFLPDLECTWITQQVFCPWTDSQMDRRPNKKCSYKLRARLIKCSLKKFKMTLYSLVNQIEPTENLRNILQ